MCFFSLGDRLGGQFPSDKISLTFLLSDWVIVTFPLPVNETSACICPQRPLLPLCLSQIIDILAGRKHSRVSWLGNFRIPPGLFFVSQVAELKEFYTLYKVECKIVGGCLQMCDFWFFCTKCWEWNPGLTCQAYTSPPRHVLQQMTFFFPVEEEHLNPPGFQREL